MKKKQAASRAQAWSEPRKNSSDKSRFLPKFQKIEYPRIYREIMSPRHRAYSYLRAFEALFLGYHDLHLLDELQRKRKRWFSASEGKNVRDGNERALAAKG
jgi:hypothetical protein